MLPFRLFLAALCTVVAAAVGLVLTKPDSAPPTVTTVSAPSVSPTPTPVTPTRKPKPKPVVKRGEVPVEIYNNSGIPGLAATTSSRARSAGWNVVGADNWYGTVPASTVYYPARLKAAALLLAKDLGVGRLKPAIAPMRGDRLTVILTSDYS